MYAWFRVSLQKYLKKTPISFCSLFNLINRNIFNLVYFLSLLSLYSRLTVLITKKLRERLIVQTSVPIEEEEEEVVLVVLVAVIIVVVV